MLSSSQHGRKPVKRDRAPLLGSENRKNIGTEANKIKSTKI
jgi:hypothetical protein